MSAVAATKDSIAAHWAGLGDWIGLATGNPGSTATPSNEVTGGSPAYARKQTTWSAGTTGVQNGTAQTIDSPAATVNYVLVASSSSGNNMVENCAVTPVTLTGQGTLVVTPQYTVT